MRIVLLGCPGAGKGTQAKILCQKYGIAHIATGDILRAEIAAKSSIGEQVSDYLKRGMLVSDDIMIAMVSKKLDASKSGWLLDGFPRTLEQAQALDAYLRKNAQKIDKVFYLAMKESAVVNRLSSRRSCSECNEVYSLSTRPPKKEGICDTCGKAVVQREDDSEATVRKRLMVYEDLTRPLVSYYRHEYEFHEIDGARDATAVTLELCTVIDGAGSSRSVA